MTQEVSIPVNLKGVYYLFITTDNEDGYCRIQNGVCVNDRKPHSQTVIESDEQNNLVFPTLSIGIPPLSDLTVNTIGVTTDAFSGDSIDVIYEVENIGERDARGLYWRFIIGKMLYIFPKSRNSISIKPPNLRNIQSI